MVQLEGVQINYQATICNGYTDYTSLSGMEAENRDGWLLVWTLNGKRVFVGCIVDYICCRTSNKQKQIISKSRESMAISIC
ncbi:MAG: hypothetical protein A2283_02440 [Lentisphaerae bacterium RIFOXYA12_FULL_48_11]|nr:MAG: hypothetical protein A2283_02440 [Lentisphaerae bacterium RIFOXYA12_FULL_48_11]